MIKNKKSIAVRYIIYCVQVELKCSLKRNVLRPLLKDLIQRWKEPRKKCLDGKKKRDKYFNNNNNIYFLYSALHLCFKALYIVKSTIICKNV